MGDDARATLTSADVRDLIAASGDTPAGLRLTALVATLFHACPRLGVALAMDVDDVDLRGARIRLRGRRTWEVRLDVEPVAHLSRWIACRAGHHLGPGPLFCTFDGARLDDSYVRRELGALGRAAGIAAPVGAEALRRAGAAHLVAAGVGDEHLRERLDHGRVGVTARYRRRLGPVTLDRARRQLVIEAAARERRRSRRLVGEARRIVAVVQQDQPAPPTGEGAGRR